MEDSKFPSIANVDWYIKKYKRCVVLGNGASVPEYTKQEGDFLIGVNDICRYIVPNVLLLVDKKPQFKSIERTKLIEAQSDCIHVVRDDNWSFKSGKTYSFSLGRKGTFTNFDKKDVIDTGWDSPYMAIQLAAKIGFKEIAVIGVDYTDNHFYAEDGTHILNKRLAEINDMYKKLTEFLATKGVHVYNISSISQITGIPKLEVKEQ